MLARPLIQRLEPVFLQEPEGVMTLGVYRTADAFAAILAGPVLYHLQEPGAYAAAPQGRHHCHPLEIHSLLVHVEIHGGVLGHMEGSHEVFLLVVNQVHFRGQGFFLDDIDAERRRPVQLIVTDEHFLAAHLEELLYCEDIRVVALADALEKQFLRCLLHLVAVQDFLHGLRHIIRFLVGQY